MAFGKSAPYCDACGSGTQANHTLLWLDGYSDALSFKVPLHRMPLYGVLLKISEVLVNLLGRLSFFGGRALGIVTLSDDTSATVSNRSRLLWEEALRRDIFMRQLYILGRPSDTFYLKHAGRSHLFTSIPLTTDPSTLRMDDKVLFKKKMREASIPVPKSFSARNLQEAQKALNELSIVCVKPRTGSNGRHTYPYVQTSEELTRAFESVKQISPFASIEKHLEGDLCRATCVNGELIGFLQSEHPHVTGNGESTIQELISRRNEQKLEGTENLSADTTVQEYITRRGYALDSILPAGIRLQLTYRGGRSVASTNREHGRSIHPSFIPIIEEAALLTELPVVGFDIIIPDPMRPADSQQWGFIEANSLPWIDLHATPYFGTPTDLSVAVWDLWESRQTAH